MRFKIDENLHPDVATWLLDQAQDAMTVHEQGLRGAEDGKLIQICQGEDRILVTLDLDFSNIFHYPPENYSGLIVLRLKNTHRDSVLSVIKGVFAHLQQTSVRGKLWIVDEHKIRVRPV